MIGADFVGDGAQRADPGRQHLPRPRLRHAPRAVRRASTAQPCSPTASPTRRRTASSSSTPTAWPSPWRRSPRTRAASSPCPACTSTTTTWSQIAREPQAVGARRVRDHRRQPALPRAGHGSRSRCSTAARPGWTPAPSTRSTTRATSSRVARAPAGTQGRCARGGRLAPGVPQRRRAARAGESRSPSPATASTCSALLEPTSLTGWFWAGAALRPSRPARSLSGSHQARLLAVPLDGVGETLLEVDLRPVAELVADLGDVDRVAQVVAEPVGRRCRPGPSRSRWPRAAAR